MIFTIMVVTANVRILFISHLHYELLLLFIAASVLLWFATFAFISGFISFPAESFDLYGSFIGLITNLVSLLGVCQS